MMRGLRQPCIVGYKLKVGSQNALIDGVLRWLVAHEGPPKPRSLGNRVVEGGGQRDAFSWAIGRTADPQFIAGTGRRSHVAAH